MTVTVHPRVAALLREGDGERLEALVLDLGRTIALERDGSLAPGAVRVVTSAPDGDSPSGASPSSCEATPEGDRDGQPAPETAAADAPEPSEPEAETPRPRSRRRVSSRSRAAQA